jgi:hypothetical protein
MSGDSTTGGKPGAPPASLEVGPLALSLDPVTNPILHLYQLFAHPGVECQDSPHYLGIQDLPLREFGGEQARELVDFFRERAFSALRVCRLRLEGQPVLNLAARTLEDCFEWSIIDDLAQAGRLSQECQEILDEWRARVEHYELSGYWPFDIDPGDTCQEVLDELAACDGEERFTLEISLDKAELVGEHLLGGPDGAAGGVSGLLWYSPGTMEAAFEDFQGFLEYLARAAERPVVLFFYEPTELYHGDFCRILSLHATPQDRAEQEAALAAQLAAVDPPLLTGYQELRARHRAERRPNLGERFDLPPALLLRQNGDLAVYPVHSTLAAGPLRSLLVYTLLAWLAEYTEPQEGMTRFVLPSSGAAAQDVRFQFSLTDVRQGDASIFETELDWQQILLLLTHDIHTSAGRQPLRALWAQATSAQDADGFTAVQLFDTLEAVRQTYNALKQERPQVYGEQPDLELHIFLDRKLDGSELTFKIHFPPLGFFYESAGSIPLGTNDPDLQFHDLNELARDHLTRVLEPDVDQPSVLRPNMQKLESRGWQLWRKLIPDDLKRDYIRALREKDLTVLLISDNPSFPWELVRPYGEIETRDGPIDFDDLWWAIRFSLARWLAGYHPPAAAIGFERVCCVATTSELSSADKELAYFERLGTNLDSPATREEFFNLLGERDYDVLHLACHGRFDVEEPGESVVQLPDRTLLHPSDLYHPKIERRFKAKHPLVFLNACHSGRTGPTLTGIGGWAERFIDMECGAFIGCGWEVSDPLAAEFAIAFYKSFFEAKETLGRAVHLARQKIKEVAEDNSSWLAYYLYGDPNCRSKET